MKIKFRIFFLLLILFLVGCTDKKDLKVASLKGPTAMGLVYTDAAKNMELVNSPDEILAKFTSGEADLVFLPVNMAANLYQKTGGQVRLLAINTVGNLYLLGKEPIEDLKELEQKTIISAGQGATPMHIINYLTKDIGVNVNYLPAHSDVVAAASQDKADYYLLPEPFVSLYLDKIQEGQIAYNLAEAYKKKTGQLLTMGALITSPKKLEEQKNEIKNFLEDYQTSVKEVLQDPESAAKLIKSYGILEDELLAKKAIPNSGIVYLNSKQARRDLDTFLQLLMEENPKAIGGSLPGKDFYEEVK